MSKPKVDQNEIGKKKILDAVIQILDQRSLYKDEYSSTESKIALIQKQGELLDSVRKTVSLSNIKGKGGVISGMGEYKFILEKAAKELADKKAVDSVTYEALDIQAYRLQNKLCERLFPDEATFIGKRLSRVDSMWNLVAEQLLDRLKKANVEDTLKKAENIFVFEEDEESMLMKRLLTYAKIPGFKAYVAHNDAFKIDGEKVVSFEEARIGKDDVLIFCASKCLREFDKEYSAEKFDCNIVEMNIGEGE